MGLGDTKLRICNFRAGEDINLAAMENTCHSGGMIRQTPSLDMDIITYFTRQTSSVFIAHNLILTKPKGHILCIYLTSYQNFTSPYRTTIIIFASFDVKLITLKEGMR